MINSTEIRMAPGVAAMNSFIEPFRSWMENLLGCSTSDSVTLEIEIPFGQLVAEDFLIGVPLDRQCLSESDAVRSSVTHWELPPGVSPRMQLLLSRDQQSLITSKEWAWDPHWKETPIAVWLKGLAHPVVVASIPYISFAENPQHKWQDWMVLNRLEIAPVLNLLRKILVGQPKRINVLGGRNIPLPPNGFDWDSVLLDARVSKMVREDFEFFFCSEAWFKQFRLPFRRGYLFYGPPGNGKTTTIRVMAMHPDITSFSLDFSNEELHNNALTQLFDDASHAAPSLIIFEDLDRLYGKAPEEQNRTRITLQHLLNCLNGLGSPDGTIVVATANNPAELDPSILRRPGRFDRIVPFHPPSLELCGEYLKRLTGNFLDDDKILSLAKQATGLSFAQVREVYIMAGQSAFKRGDSQITDADLLEGIKVIRCESESVGSHFAGRGMGFRGESLEARA